MGFVFEELDGGGLQVVLFCLWFGVLVLSIWGTEVITGFGRIYPERIELD